MVCVTEPLPPGKLISAIFLNFPSTLAHKSQFVFFAPEDICTSIFTVISLHCSSQYWRDIVSELRLAGFDGSMAIEHEDSLMSVREGLEKAVAFMRDVLIFEPAAEMWWA